jgi:cell division protein FtsB
MVERIDTKKQFCVTPPRTLMARKGIIRQNTVVLICLGLATYFGYHAIKGRHGLETHLRLSAKQRALKEQLVGLEAVLSHLKRDVALLGDDHLDEDSLDEAARSGLGYAADGEIVMLTAPPAQN